MLPSSSPPPSTERQNSLKNPLLEDETRSTLSSSPPPLSDDGTSTTTSVRSSNSSNTEIVLPSEPKSISALCKDPAFSGLMVTTFLIAVSIGTVYTLVPSRLTFIYGRDIYYDGRLEDEDDEAFSCEVDDNGDYENDDYSAACQQGNDKAQDLSSYADFTKNILTFMCAPLLGGYTDIRGRKTMLALSSFIQSFPILAFALMVYYEDYGQDSSKIVLLFANLYNVAYALTGFVFYLALIFSCAADVLSFEERAVGFGVLMALFLTGISLVSF
jgi:hypothetical protein